MEKNRSSKILAIIALLVSAIGLSVGFAAFSQTLTIRPKATVAPSSDDFKVVFSSNGTALETSPVLAQVTPSTLVATSGKIDNSTQPTIEDLEVHFTAPGQKAVYTFYAANIGKYEAFLKSIVFENADGADTHKSCVAGVGTTAAYVNEACKSISLTVNVADTVETSSSKTGITGVSVGKDNFQKIVVTIDYAENGARADGDFTVNFGDIVLDYSSAN